MKKLFNISILGVLLILLAAGCKEKPLPKAKLYPGIHNPVVPAIAYAQVPYEYQVDDMTGADFSWAIGGIVNEIDGDPEENGWQGAPTDEVIDADYASACQMEYPYDFTKSIVQITMAPVDSTVFVQLLVTSTTENGSLTDTLYVEVAPFCPPSSYDGFNGTDVTATDTIGLDFDGSKPVCSITTDNEGNAKITLNGALAATFISWDDNQNPEINYDIPVKILLDNPNIQGPAKQLYAHTVETGADWYYYFEDVHGTYDNCGSEITIVLRYKVHYISEGYDGYFSKGAYFWTKFTIVNGKVATVNSGVEQQYPFMVITK